MKAPSRKLLALVVVGLFAVIAAIAAANNALSPGVRNGVVTACVEPATKGNKATSGDLNMSSFVCGKGARTISWNIRGPAGPAGPAGSAGPQGGQGPAGAQGAAGARGATGDTGATGATGATGPAGPPGDAGPPGKDAPTPEYGVGAVDVTRGTSTATWAIYSTPLGSPVGDTTGGSFRLSCSASQAPCAVAVKAAALSDNSGTVGLWPRLLLTQDLTGVGTVVFCEYGDGSTGAAPATLTKQAKSASPTYAAVPLNIGGTYDCPGGTGSGGDVASISLPVGHYNVYATFSFLPGTTLNFLAGD